jgi:hypothetical protein
MTRSIEEGDSCLFSFSGGVIYLICTDMLGDAPCFACNNVGLPNVVEDGGFAACVRTLVIP